jgi:hypothetical protein
MLIYGGISNASFLAVETTTLNEFGMRVGLSLNSRILINKDKVSGVQMDHANVHE